MSKIKFLEPDQIVKIAAGEVVRRPASIVKELVENSLDAGADFLTLKIIDGGKKLVEISDNGFGMSAADARLCAGLHATSKISEIDDLLSLQSFGFRGEALASIAAVSKLKIVTREQDSSLGTSVTFNCSQDPQLQEDVACNVGTTISCHDLFDNIPARKKFLKSAETESNQVSHLINAFALANPKVTFKFLRDEKLVLHAPAVDSLLERASQVFDSKVAQNFIEFGSQGEALKVFGLTSNLQVHNYSRNHIFIFINNRLVKDPKITSAVCNGYAGALPDRKFPTTILFVELNQKNVDVNVHPCKDEVHYSQPGAVRLAIKNSITSALEKNSSDSLKGKCEIDVFGPSSLNLGDCVNSLNNGNKKQLVNDVKNSAFATSDSWQEPAGVFPSQEPSIPVATVLKPSSVFATAQQSSIVIESGRSILGQLFATYILFEKDQKFFIVDQHAASERIIYENLKSNFESSAKINLIFPEIINLKKSRVKFLLDHQDLLTKFVELEQFDRNSVVVKALPPGVTANQATDLLLTILQHLEGEGHVDSDMVRKSLFEHVHSHLACKTAIKAGDVLTPVAMEKLLQSLDKVPNKFQCIHGRPTIYDMDKNYIERLFRRK